MWVSWRRFQFWKNFHVPIVSIREGNIFCEEYHIYKKKKKGKKTRNWTIFVMQDVTRKMWPCVQDWIVTSYAKRRTVICAYLARKGRWLTSRTSSKCWCAVPSGTPSYLKPVSWQGRIQSVSTSVEFGAFFFFFTKQGRFWVLIFSRPLFWHMA